VTGFLFIQLHHLSLETAAGGDDLAECLAFPVPEFARVSFQVTPEICIAQHGGLDDFRHALAEFLRRERLEELQVHPDELRLVKSAQ